MLILTEHWFIALTHCVCVCGGVVANMLDSNVVVNDFELQSRYYVHFWIYTFGKGMNLLFLQL